MWFDAMEDRQLRGARGAAAAIDVGSTPQGTQHDTQAKVMCPRCNTRMVRMVDREQPHVWYESCSVCHGTFFDAGEFRDLTERSLTDLFKRWRKGERKLD
jgi:Zn-finger nucleic acid-binding protein